jgi:hypothetical protein
MRALGWGGRAHGSPCPAGAGWGAGLHRRRAMMRGMMGGG